MTPSSHAAQQDMCFAYRDNWNRGLRWWERVALCFQRVTLTYDAGLFIATKRWRGTIYVIATGKLHD